MCGIAAIFAYHTGAPSVNEGELVAIRDHMTARGPDGSGLWLDATRRLGLGHRRLSIIDLSPAGAQPMHLSERQLAIVFNGEIYNYRELRTALEAKGHVFQSTSDTEVLLHLYAEHGEAMVNELRGMYAFALWDGAKCGLLLARDPFGIKPLYVADDGQTLRVASQVKALLAGGKIDTAPEPAGHVGFFLWGHVPEPYTFYRGIRSLPAGSTLWLGPDGARRAKTFCSIPELLRTASLLRRDRGEPDATLAHQMGEGLGVRAAGEVSSSSSSSSTLNPQLSTALRDSVAHHLIADVPVGVFLSSGLDSTTLAALAAEQGGQLRTVTLGFEEYRGTANDETPLAELVARQYGAQHQTVWVKRQDFQDHGERLFAAMDQPTTDGVNTYFVSHAAKQASLKVALSGLGGDELFGGYPSFKQIPRSVRALGSMLHAPRIGRAFRFVSAPMMKHFTSPKYAGLLEYGGSYGGAYLLRRGMFMPWELPEILDPDLVREGWAELNTLAALNQTADLSPLRADRGESDATLAPRMGEGLGIRASGGCSISASQPSSLNSQLASRLRISALETCWYMRNQLLRDSDWASMAHSLEIRVPLVDTTLLRSLLPALGSNTPPTKRDLAAAPRSPLPAAVLNRSKTGFTIPVSEWMRSAALGSRPSTLDPRPTVDRGLRGWAREVHSRFPGTDCVLATRGKSRKQKPETGNRQSASHQPSTYSDQLGSAPRSSLPAPSKILVFRIGQLGDTIVALPALWAVKAQFPEARLTLLCDRHPGKAHVLGATLFADSGLFDRFEYYPVHHGVLGRFRQGKDMLQLLGRLRKEQFDTLVYLVPNARSPQQITRDLRFFRAAGIAHFIGTQGFAEEPNRKPNEPLAAVPHEADLLLARLAQSGITVPPPGSGRMALQLGPTEEREVAAWLDKVSRPNSAFSSQLSAFQEATASSRPWVGFGPGSKMPAKRWPLERFAEVGQKLIAEFDIWPVIFGGPEDAEAAAGLLRHWGRGYSAAGGLSVRGAAQALKQCRLYVGNDTGTMHLAAAVNTPCLAVFSARDRPGRWFPYGPGHRVFRSQIECEGCGLIECVERRNECLNRITAGEVLAGCQPVLRANRSGRAANAEPSSRQFA